MRAAILTVAELELLMLPSKSRPGTVAATIRSAYECARQGQIARAQALCEDVLREAADHPDALLLRAVIEMQMGRPAPAADSARLAIAAGASRPGTHALLGDALLALGRSGEALESYEAALRGDAGCVAALYGRANALLDLGRPLDALQSYDRLIAIRPDDADALFNRGNALLRLRRLDAALESYEAAIRRSPAHAAAFNNLGSAQMMLKRHAAALASFDAAVVIEPQFIEALHNRGCALRDLRRPLESLEAIDAALRLRPDFTQALVSRGQVLRELKRPHDALESFEQAVRLKADSADAQRGRGDALLDLERFEDALAAYDAAQRLDSGLAQTYVSRGNCLRALRRFAAAIECYDSALRLEPDHADAHFHRGTAYLQWDREPEEALASYARALALNPEFDFAPGALYYGLRNHADWQVAAAAAAPDAILQSVLECKRVVAPFPFLSVTDSAEAQLRCAQTYSAYRCPSAERIVPVDRTPTVGRDSGSRGTRERLRVAYVSADFREHPVSYLMAGVFERHDRRRFEPFAISLSPEEASPMGRRVRRAFCGFFEVGARNDRQIADFIRSLQIDIAVDMTGFTDGFRPQIFAQRCAPIQVNYLGFPGTMGAPFMDYILGDDFVIPPEEQVHYSERVVYLPDCFQANDSQRAIGGRTFERIEVGLPPDAFVFCCFNNTYKINPGMFDIWMRLLRRAPDSVLWLLGSREAVRENLRREAAAREVDPARLVFTPRQPYLDYLGMLPLADLYLDTLPFNAGTTASDALWAGVPLLTCAGNAFAARMAGSLLRAIRLPELITHSLEEYERQALNLALDRAGLARLRQRLRGNRTTTPLFDTDLFRRGLESAYETMWLRHERGEGPAGFRVQPLS
jgi:predicted O-linked N-acetylglucosamine transferase (SPINDLY family)